LAIDNDKPGFWSWLRRDQQPGLYAPADKEDHFANFIACVVSRQRQDIRTPIEEGHISSGLAHLAIASYRLERTLNFDPQTQLVKNDDEADTLLRDGKLGSRPPFVVPEQI
jgi:hypothetical protein